MRPTFHLVPAATWVARDSAMRYAPDTLATEGFIHCTDGQAELIATANRHYRDDPRPFLALMIDLDAAGSPWAVEDPRGVYPHVFGPVDLSAILEQRPLVRSADGRFEGLGEATPVAPPR